MKKTIVILFAGILYFHTTHAQKYFGKSYPATETVDEYFDSSDVKKSYTVMGKAELLKGFRSLEKAKQKIIKLAKQRGADGVIFSMQEEIYGTSSSSGVNIDGKKKDKIRGSLNTTTTDMKQIEWKRIIKYLNKVPIKTESFLKLSVYLLDH